MRLTLATLLLARGVRAGWQPAGSAPSARFPSPRCAASRPALVSPVATMGLLEDCGGSADTLAKQLTKEQLKQECAARKLRLTGTKAELAPRLIAAMRAELAAERSAEGSTPAASAVEARGPALRDMSPAAAKRRRRAAPQLPTGAGSATAAAASSEPGAATAGASPLIAAPFEADWGAGSGADLEVTVLGSGACNPSPSRSASCLALRVIDSFWLFDAGEGTQVQLQRCSVRPSKISKIFVTHAHGDHCFGLPGLLCLIARNRDSSLAPLEIYGPVGLRAFLRIALRFSGTRLLPRYVVHELHSVPYLHKMGRRPRLISDLGGEPPASPSDAGEQPGGRNIEPADDGSWWTLLTNPFGEAPSEGALRVRAAPVRHTAPTVGFVIDEASKPGRLQPERVLPLLERNRAALRDAGVPDPRVLLKKVKALGPDEELRLPDGAVIRGRDVIGEARRGRKVTVLGDCSDASLVAPIATGSDLVVHEATNAFLPRFGDQGTYGAFERETISHGHSTPNMAGRTAALFRSRALLLTHFSQRYHPNSHNVMNAIKRVAIDASRLDEDAVHCAHDGMVIPLWQTDRDKPIGPL